MTGATAKMGGGSMYGAKQGDLGPRATVGIEGATHTSSRPGREEIVDTFRANVKPMRETCGLNSNIDHAPCCRPLRGLGTDHHEKPLHKQFFNSLLRTPSIICVVDGRRKHRSDQWVSHNHLSSPTIMIRGNTCRCQASSSPIW